MFAPAVDVHVHLHPERLARAIERHFAEHDRWVNVHPFDPDQVAATLRARDVSRFCFFSYAHKPGIARALNEWTAKTASRLPAAIPLGTVHAADPDAVAVVAEALDDLGLRGIKLHHSVQRFPPDDARLFPVYERLTAADAVLMTHAGTLPYRDAHTGADRLRAVMRRFPRLRVCVAHMGRFEHEQALAMTEEFEHLYVDTTMALSPLATPYVGGDPADITTEQLLRHQDKILFGSDFPLIPYDYAEEHRFADDRQLPDPVQRKIFHDNAVRFLGL